MASNKTRAFVVGDVVRVVVPSEPPWLNLGEEDVVTGINGGYISLKRSGGGWSPTRFELVERAGWKEDAARATAIPTTDWVNFSGPFAPPFMENATTTSDTKPTNPKDALGSDKLPLHLVPPQFTAGTSLALLDGAMKYGRTNWREAGVRATIYNDATRRHLDAWMEGENEDPESGLPHLYHAAACLAIVIDALHAGCLTDDRNYVTGTYRGTITEMSKHVRRLKGLHASRKMPKHCTITDKAA